MKRSPLPKRTTAAPPPLLQALIATGDGCFTAEFSEHGLRRLSFPAPSEARPARHLKVGKSSTTPPRAWLRQTQAAVADALKGRAPRVLPPLDLSCGTPFQRQVWQALQEIAPGETRSYGAIAQLIGRPRAVRAVGAACGANPVPLLVPCHRVLTANGRIGGFSGGPQWKPELLRREGSWK